MKKPIRATGIVGVVVIFICAVVFGFGIVMTGAQAQTSESMTERELYNETNTYNANEECFETDGKIKIIPDENRVTDDYQYRISYDMSVKNENRVMSAPQVTVLTHGLGGSARSNV